MATSGQADAKILADARERFRFSAEAERELRTLQAADQKFAAGEHWPADIKRDRIADGRPCLTIDRLMPQIKQVTNALRNDRPGIDVEPRETSDTDTSDAVQGLIRYIETTSDADLAYYQAAKDAATMGRGWFGILTAYDDPTRRTQEPIFRRIRNPFTVYPDPTRQRLDYADMRFAFVTADLPKAEYQRQYPTSKAASLTDFTAIGDYVADWFLEDAVRVAEYWYVEGDLDDPNHTVCCVTMNGLEILKRFTWAGNTIPLIPVIDEEWDLGGKVDYRGITRRAKDPQWMYNVWKSATTELVALAPKTPYILAEGQDKGYEKMWAAANRRNFPALKYKPVGLNGVLAPPPQRSAGIDNASLQGLIALSVGAESDLRATTSHYDVSETNGPEQSGKAILARKRQGELGNSDVAQGLRVAIRRAGRILLEIIPKLYDVPRVRRILGPDGQAQTVVLHAGKADEAQALAQQQGIQKIFDVADLKCDVVVKAGQSFESARQEFIDMMGQLYQGQPQLFALTGDLFLQNLDVPYAKQMAERLKRMLPPPLQEAEGGPPAVPPEVQARLQQMEQIIAQQQKDLESSRVKELEISVKAQIAQLQAQLKQVEIASREKTAVVSEETKRYVAQLAAAAKADELATQTALDLHTLQHSSEEAARQRDADLQRDAAQSQTEPTA